MTHAQTEKARNRDLYYQKQISLMSELKDQLPHYEGILSTYEQVLREREKYRSRLCELLEPIVPDDPFIYQARLQKGLPMLDKNDIEFNNQVMSEHLARLIRIFKAESRNRSAGLSDSLLQKKNLSLNVFFNSARQPGKCQADDKLMDFLVSETINPVLELYTEKIKNRINFAEWEYGYCPVCGEFPTMAALNSDTGKRTLISAACRTEWTFSRIKCPWCENEDQHLLSYFYIANDERYRVETCDMCGHYIKTIDLRKTDLSVDYEIENIITIHLDLIARENGYINDGLSSGARTPGPTAVIPQNEFYH